MPGIDALRDEVETTFVRNKRNSVEDGTEVATVAWQIRKRLGLAQHLDRVTAINGFCLRFLLEQFRGGGGGVRAHSVPQGT